MGDAVERGAPRRVAAHLDPSHHRFDAVHCLVNGRVLGDRSWMSGILAGGAYRLLLA
jgi:hypothetical protein